MAKMSQKEDRGFRYQKRTKDDLKERANMKGGSFDTYIKPKFKQWKPKDGKNLIRILPPTWDDARHYGLDIFINFNIGPDNQSYLSLSKHGKGDDPLAEARREAQKDGEKELAKALNPNQRILYWIIDRNDEDEGPILWAAPFTFDKSLSNLCIDEDTKEVIFIDDPLKGRDVRFYKEGAGLTTKYDPSKMKVLGESTICEDEALEQDWLDFIQDNPLPEVLNFYDYDHIKASFDGQAGRREDDDPEEKPARGRQHVSHRASDPPDEDAESRPTPRRRPAQAEDDPVDTRPVRTRARPAVVDPDEDPEVDPSPPPRGRVRTRPDPEGEPELPLGSRRGRTEDAEAEGGSLRDRLARRRSRPTGDDD